MANEIEAKIRVADFTSVIKALGRAGAEFLGETIETDQFFDTPGCALLQADRGLRLRTTKLLKAGKDGRQCKSPPLLTYKGPRQRGKRVKIRREIQTVVADAQAVVEILQALGFRKSLVVRKRRRSFRMDRCRVELDQLKGVGCFVEVEGPTGRQVEAVCRKLNLPGERITHTYASMMAQRQAKTK